MANRCPACEAKQVAEAAFCHLCGTALNQKPQASDDAIVKRRRKRRRPPRDATGATSKTRFDERRPRRDGTVARDDQPDAIRKNRSATSKTSKRTSKPNRPEPGKLRAPSDDAEQELWSDTFSAKGLINYWLAVAAGSIVLPVAASYAHVDANAWKLVLALIGAAWMAMIGWLIFLKLDAYYVLTTQRFTHERGILTRHTRRIEVIDIDDISFRQGIIERFLNVGSIEIISSDKSDPIFEFDGIDNVHEVALVIDEARRAERVRRGIHIEAV